eukprot:670230-Alexandrium_andersonii.AAC.1
MSSVALGGDGPLGGMLRGWSECQGALRWRALQCGFDVLQAGGELGVHCARMGLVGGSWRGGAWSPLAMRRGLGGLA